MPAKLTRDGFIRQAVAAHGNTYDYTDTVYHSTHAKVSIKCNQCGNTFEQTPAAHIRGAGCRTCASARASARLRDTIETFVTKARAIHGSRYDYSKSTYTRSGSPTTIVCPDHGEFQQRPNAHLRGAGCPACWSARRKTPMRDELGVLDQFAVIHGDTYDYSQVLYTGMHEKVTIVCRKHKAFDQTPNNHIKGAGCPVCGQSASKAERDIAAAVEALGCVAQPRYRPTWMNGKELDVFVPEHNLAIEYCGSHVHNSTRNHLGGEPKDKWYHYDKWKLCRDNGVTLLTIYDFDWFANREKWEAVIKHKIQKADRRVYARKCQIVPVERTVARDFCQQHHIEGVGGMWKMTTECKGLEYNGELVAIMACEDGDIKRSCTLSGTAVIGGVSKLFKSFPTGTTMMTTNNTGSSGNYGTLLKKKTLRYWWVKASAKPLAIPRRQCQKHLLESKFGEPLNGRTERQYMEDLGFVKCYDSGLSYWVNK